MSKRAQKKHLIQLINVKERWFVLTKKELAYFEGGGPRNMGTMKGTVPIETIIDVEVVEEKDQFGFKVGVY